MMLALAAPAVVWAVAARFAQSQKGIVTFRLHRVFDVHAGPKSRHDDIVFDGVYEDGTLVNMRIRSYTIGGKQADSQQQSQFEDDWLHPKAIFHFPFDPRYVEEYLYRVSGKTVAFTPLSADASHGTGVFTYDKQRNVVSFTYSPGVMPEYARSGTIADQRAPVLSNYWAVTHETQEYTGRYALWNGGATVDLSWTSFRRAASVQQAEAYISRNP
jgi:hypothetical protein